MSPRSNQMVQCPTCTGKMSPRARHGCRGCFHGGRPHDLENIYARELGIKPSTLKRLGGMAKLKAMDESARNVLLKSMGPGKSQTWRKGGLAGRGYESYVPGSMRPGYLIEPPAAMGLPLETMATDEVLDGVSVEGWE